MKRYFTLLFVALATLVSAQTTYQGNGASGFGGTVGNGSITFNNTNSTQFTIDFQAGDNANLGNAVVLYIDTGVMGRQVIDSDVRDLADGLRVAISRSSGTSDDSILAFPAGFEASHAIAFDNNFAGIWSIPVSGVIGDNGLNYVDTANLVNNGIGSYSLTVDFADLGLTQADAINFVGSLISTTGFGSDESFGASTTTSGGNAGFDGTTTISSSNTFQPTLSTNDFDVSAIDVLIMNRNLMVTGTNTSSMVAIYNTLGQEMLRRDTLAAGESLDLSSLSSGILIVRVQDAVGNTLSRKLILR